MEESLYSDIQAAIHEHLVPLLLGVLLVFQTFSLVLIIGRDMAPGLQGVGESGEMLSVQEKTEKLSLVPKLSSLRGAHIDTEAAMVVLTPEGETVPVSICETPQTRLGVFLLIAYISLLLFNLTFDFGKTTKIQWGWELILTALPVLFWYGYDECLLSPWFPLAVIEFGIILYVLYIYFFDRAQKKRGDAESR